MKINKKIAILALSVMVIVPTSFALANSTEKYVPMKTSEESYECGGMNQRIRGRNFDRNQSEYNTQNGNGNNSENNRMNGNFQMRGNKGKSRGMRMGGNDTCFDENNSEQKENRKQMRKFSNRRQRSENREMNNYDCVNGNDVPMEENNK